MGRSESPRQIPECASAASVAAELDSLLRNAGIAPPFIILCHSWGGFTAREFLHIRPNDIVGMVFVDCNTEHTFDEETWGLDVFDPIIHGQDFIQSTGLAAAQISSEEDWKAVTDEQMDPPHQKTEAAEARGAKGDGRALYIKEQLKKQSLHSYPVSVIIADTPGDFQRCTILALPQATERKKREHIVNEASPDGERKTRIGKKNY